MASRKCVACGKGEIKKIAKFGRRTKHRGMEIDVPSDLPIPTCDNCGEEFIDGDSARMIEAVLDTQVLKLRIFDAIGIFSEDGENKEKIRRVCIVLEDVIRRTSKGFSVFN